MVFEYDPDKSASNLEKHGIDFDDIQELWCGDLVSFRANVHGEQRFKGIGRIAGEYWAVVYTKRGEATRIISARRATQQERSAYDRFTNQR